MIRSYNNNKKTVRIKLYDIFIVSGLSIFIIYFLTPISSSSILILVALFFSVGYCAMGESLGQGKRNVELGKTRHREIYLVRFAGSGVAAMFWTPGAPSCFRREDIADCLLVPFDFFSPLLCRGRTGRA